MMSDQQTDNEKSFISCVACIALTSHTRSLTEGESDFCLHSLHVSMSPCAFLGCVVGGGGKEREGWIGEEKKGGERREGWRGGEGR